MSGLVAAIAGPFYLCNKLLSGGPLAWLGIFGVAIFVFGIGLLYKTFSK